METTSLKLTEMEVLAEATECLKVLAHPVRLRMIEMLSQGEYQVQELADTCSIKPHQASEHLRLMQSHKMLASERRGRSVYYRIADAHLAELLRCIQQKCREIVANRETVSPG